MSETPTREGAAATNVATATIQLSDINDGTLAENTCYYWNKEKEKWYVTDEFARIKFESGEGETVDVEGGGQATKRRGTFTPPPEVNLPPTMYDYLCT